MSCGSCGTTARATRASSYPAQSSFGASQAAGSSSCRSSPDCTPCVVCPPACSPRPRPCCITICTPPVPCGPCPPICVPYCPISCAPNCSPRCLSRVAARPLSWFLQMWLPTITLSVSQWPEASVRHRWKFVGSVRVACTLYTFTIYINRIITQSSKISEKCTSNKNNSNSRMKKNSDGYRSCRGCTVTMPAMPTPQPKRYVPKRPCCRPGCFHTPRPVCCRYLYWRLPCKAHCFEVW